MCLQHALHRLLSCMMRLVCVISVSDNAHHLQELDEYAPEPEVHKYLHSRSARMLANTGVCDPPQCLNASNVLLAQRPAY